MNLKSIFLIFFIGSCFTLSYYIGESTSPYYNVEKMTLDVKSSDDGQYYIYKGEKEFISKNIEIGESSLSPEKIKEAQDKNVKLTVLSEIVFEELDEGKVFYKLTVKGHYGFWSLLPALVAIFLCWLLKEPIISLSCGIISGALVLGKINIIDEVLIPNVATTSAATILILYLWLLGGLMGVWSKTGASKAFALWVTKRYVKGPRSAKLVAWVLGILFFQGGTISAVLVGTTVKPLADEEKISHEELSLIVDSTSSPIAALLAFNAWPGYIQVFMFLPGVIWLSTEADRISFFFSCIPLSFYAIFAVISTFLLSIDKLPFMGKRLRTAINRARTTGQLDGPNAEPLNSSEFQVENHHVDYKASMFDFILPLLTVLIIAIGTFVAFGSPKVLWAFAIALLLAMAMALIKGMPVTVLVEGMVDGMKGVVIGSVILLLAVTIGAISKDVGGGAFLASSIGSWLPYWSMPVFFFILTVVIAFSTGTSWGTFAVSLPLALPLAFVASQSPQISDPQFFMQICFVACINGAIFGDQCSPISDTTILSSMCTGCDLMDHVKTQIPVACLSGALAMLCWTILVFFA